MLVADIEGNLKLLLIMFIVGVFLVWLLTIGLFVLLAGLMSA